jgi:hypothetical protein
MAMCEELEELLERMKTAVVLLARTPQEDPRHHDRALAADRAIDAVSEALGWPSDPSEHQRCCPVCRALQARAGRPAASLRVAVV